MTETSGVILVGPGLIGKKHAALILENPASRLAAIVAPDHENNRAFASKCNTAFSADFEQALDRDGVDGVIISSPNTVHFEQAMICIERGIPVLVEKPITDDLTSARDLVRASELRGVPVLVGHHRAHSSLLELLETYLNSAEFGRLVCVNATALFYKPEDYFREGEWRTKPGGGPILINIIHEIGLMRQLCGEIVSVFAVCSNAVRGFEVEDTVALTFAFAGGALGSFLLSDAAASSKSWEMTSGENPAYPYYPNENCYHFAGTMGSIDFPSMHVRSYAAQDTPSWWLPFEDRRLSMQRSDPLKSQLSHFLDVVKGRVQPRVSARDGYRNLLVIEAITRSLQSGRSISVDDLEIEAS